MGRLSQAMKKEISDPLFWRDVLVELIGTLLLVAGHTAVALPYDSKTPVPILTIGLASGLSVFGIIASLEHLSGGFINPVVPFAFVFTRVVSPLKAFVIMIAECVGGVAGSAIVYSCTPDEYKAQIGPLQLHPSVSVAQGISIEILQTSFLLFVAAAVFDAKNRLIRHPALAIGMTVSANIIIFGKYTGGCMNPALVLGTAIVSGVWKDHWIYWVGDATGAVLGAVVYQYIFHWLTARFKGTPQKSKQEQLDLLMDTVQRLVPAEDSQITRHNFSNGKTSEERHRLTENTSSI